MPSFLSSIYFAFLGSYCVLAIAYFDRSLRHLLDSLFFLISGIIIITISFKLFKRKKTTINPIKIEKASSLVTSGIFKYSRNPMYFGMVLILISTATKFNFYGGILMIVIFVFYITYFQILPEEKAMLKLFGKDFINYKNKTRRWF